MIYDLALSADAIENQGIFLGGPKNAFTRVGRNQLIALLDAGLTSDCKVLDVGCGCLRGGWWLINFLLAECYYGIEPNKIMLDAGLRHLLGDDLVTKKNPIFSSNEYFDFGVFGVHFDFVVARSVWSHAAPRQINKMFDSFVANTTDNGCFVTSYRETTEVSRQYNGDEWVGRSHQSDIGGMIEYTYEWLAGLADARDLNIERMHLDYGQRWLKIYKKSSQIQHLISREPKNGRVLY